jgi:cysteine-rich repeat protein
MKSLSILLVVLALGCPVPEEVPVCGDGELGGVEACDDDNLEDGDGCESDCTLSCGNGTVDPVEVCDDGNAQGGDGCSAACLVEEGHAFEGVDPKEGGIPEVIVNDFFGGTDAALTIHGTFDGEGTPEVFKLQYVGPELTGIATLDLVDPLSPESCGIPALVSFVDGDGNLRLFEDPSTLGASPCLLIELFFDDSGLNPGTLTIRATAEAGTPYILDLTRFR